MIKDSNGPLELISPNRMLFLNAGNRYEFSYATLKVIDQTAVDEDFSSVEREIPEFNVLIPTVQAIGTTNKMELYWPDELSRYLRNHGNRWVDTNLTCSTSRTISPPST